METYSFATHVEKVVKNCCRFSFEYCENEICIHNGGRKSQTYTQKVVNVTLSSMPNVCSALRNRVRNDVQLQFTQSGFSALLAAKHEINVPNNHSKQHVMSVQVDILNSTVNKAMLQRQCGGSSCKNYNITKFNSLNLNKIP